MLERFKGYLLPEWWGEVTEDFLASNGNGCGAQGWRIDLVPDALMGIEYEVPCLIHDIEYAMGLDKDAADDRLALNMGIACLNQHPEKFHHFLPIINIYFASVHMAGHEHFGKRVVQ
jgi:hypothetical protein